MDKGGPLSKELRAGEDGCPVSPTAVIDLQVSALDEIFSARTTQEMCDVLVKHCIPPGATLEDLRAAVDRAIERRGSK